MTHAVRTTLEALTHATSNHAKQCTYKAPPPVCSGHTLKRRCFLEVRSCFFFVLFGLSKRSQLRSFFALCDSVSLRAHLLALFPTFSAGHILSRMDYKTCPNAPLLTLQLHKRDPSNQPENVECLCEGGRLKVYATSDALLVMRPQPLVASSAGEEGAAAARIASDLELQTQADEQVSLLFLR